ncbi:MAG: hypothetical protein JWN34_5217 [Bryobacterales bacterium]|nr:hypothetical protein [Bryobacterales bacterium]
MTKSIKAAKKSKAKHDPQPLVRDQLLTAQSGNGKDSSRNPKISLPAPLEGALAQRFADLDFTFRGGPMTVLSDMPSSFKMLDARYTENLYLMLRYVFDVANYLRA